MISVEQICKLADEFYEAVPETTRSAPFNYSTQLAPEIESIRELTKDESFAKRNFNKVREKGLVEAFLKIERLAGLSAKLAATGDKDLIFNTSNIGIVKNVEIMSDMFDLVRKLTGLD